MSSPSAPSAPTPDEAPRERPPAAPSTAVARVESLDARIRYAQTLAAGGSLLPRGVTQGVSPNDRDAIAGRIFLMAETGGMLNIHPIAALQGVNVIEGKPTLSPALMTALVRRAGHRVRTRVEGSVEAGDIKAVCEVRRADDPDWPFTSTWTLERAARAGLLTINRDDRTGKTSVRAQSSGGKALPWQNYTEAMLKARAIGEACRDAAEDVLLGAHYTPEEMGADVDEEGMIVGEVVSDAHHTPPARPAPPAAPAADSAEPSDDDVLLAHVYGLASKAQDAAELGAAWESGVAAFARSSMAADGQTFGGWAARQSVDVHGRTVTLRDLFAELGAAARQAAAGAQNPPASATTAPTPQGGSSEAGNGPQRGVYASTDEGDVVDAEVEPDPIPAAPGTECGIPGRGGYTIRDGVDPEDPWAQGGAGVPAPEPEPGVEAVSAILGGEVVDVEGEGVTPAEERHVRATAARAKAEGAGRQAPPMPDNTPPRTSGREAVRKAREDIARKQQEAAERGE